MKLLLLLCLGWSVTARAQGTGGTYSAPGMPVHLQHGILIAPVRPPKRIVPITKKGDGVLAASRPINSPVFLRFWHQSEPARSQATRTYYQFQQQHIKYPVTSLRAGIGGTIAARLTILPDGKVVKVTITRHILDEGVASIDAPSSVAETALDAEVMRVVYQMRFEPSTIPADTVTVIQRFVFQ